MSTTQAVESNSNGAASLFGGPTPTPPPAGGTVDQATTTSKGTKDAPPTSTSGPTKDASDPPIRGTFALSFASETIKLILGDKTDTSKQQVYYLHINKLRSTSEYFARLFDFKGSEVTQKEICLDEDFDHLKLAFDAFVEYMYTGTYAGCGVVPPPQYFGADIAKPDTAELDASVIVLAERLVVHDLKEKALSSLGLKLSEQRPVRDVNNICDIITMVYGGTHRPYGDVPPTSAFTFAAPVKPVFGGPQGIAPRVPATRPTPPSTPAPPTQSGDRVIVKSQPAPASQNSWGRPAVGYKNNKARKVVARHAAQHLSRYRLFPEFRECVAEIGEFAMDLIMEPINVLDSGLVVVS
ncbi:hypothetical protein BJ508DRAFT_155700 [Ascobolus immersus RN42]|uniref:BTB domain-containing protein n=1 Tax=Ascobolus immersus RN42 TaxID=1160509 RepID=A0A3N4HX85_ASCIM|nr:hypothetical protein BJ508DRAFT_155700 [Ascobolus immersus RN42]